MTRTRIVLVTGLAVALSAGPASGAAYYVGEIGTRTLGRGGANIVNPRDPSAVWLNPAAATNSTGVRLQLNNNLIYLTSENKRTLALGLAHLRSVQATEWGMLMAAGMLMVAPALLLFFVAQRFFIEGIALTGTKF